MSKDRDDQSFSKDLHNLYKGFYDKPRPKRDAFLDKGLWALALALVAMLVYETLSGSITIDIFGG